MLTVNLGEQSYDILIDSGVLATLGRLCVGRGLAGRVAVITNPSVAALYADLIHKSLADAGNQVTVLQIPDGEGYKNTTTLNRVYDELIEAGLNRTSFIVALGGGVVGDLAGFAAATYMRGIPFVQVPTTLLAQVDSSVGGKTAVDHPRGKNLIGAFYQPRLVLIDVATLSTLPKREFLAGLAEVVKYGVTIDQAFFDYLEQNSDRILAMEPGCLAYVIQRCCELKARVVELDEKETGLRAILNYGHTLGHAFETLAGYSSMVHGEAVAIGMACAARVSVACGHCTVEDSARIIDLLNRFGLPFTPPQVEKRHLMDTLLTDKKCGSGVIKFICNRGIGDHVVENLTTEQLLTLSGLEV
ncbi:MAG: 3-dehydroquinate synthase [Desulfuromonadales bacterium]|nr:3-dehydroquinate synthase [Desulfuromonadales bacterium]